MLAKILPGITFSAVSNYVGLMAAENNYSNHLLNGVETLTRLASFCDLSSPASLIGAMGITALSSVDDLMIERGSYLQHNLTKAGCAAYAGYKLSMNKTLIGSYTGYMDGTALGIVSSFGLLAISTLIGSGDIIATMRKSTKEAVDFSSSVRDLTGGKVDPYKALYLGAGANLMIGGLRQFAKDYSYNFEMGGPLSDAVQYGIGLGANCFVGNALQQELGDAIYRRLASLDKGKLAALENDPRAHQAIKCLNKFDFGKVTGKYYVKNSYQQMLACQESDFGLTTFVVASLLNNFAEVRTKKAQSTALDAKPSSLLEELKQKDEKGSNGKFLDKAIMAPPLILAGSILVSAMKSPSAGPTSFADNSLCSSSGSSTTRGDQLPKFLQSKDSSKHFTPLSTTFGMDFRLVDPEIQRNLDDLKYLFNKVDEITADYILI